VDSKRGMGKDIMNILIDFVI